MAIQSLVTLVLEHGILSISLIVLSTILGYYVCQCYLHPLAKYPGPTLACLTDLWQVTQFLGLKQPYNLTKLHEQYGPVVRYGPDKLSITDEKAIPLLYQKGGRMFPKTEFYDAYGSSHPNIFGMRDEAQHATRRRHMSHSFSLSYVKELEKYLDVNIAILRRRIGAYASSGESFDLKRVLHHYVVDVLGELAFSESFGVQEANDDALVPPVAEHSLLAAATGAWPSMTKNLKRWLPLLPSQRLRNLFDGRQKCSNLAAECVARRLADLKVLRESGDDKPPVGQRRDILTGLILAKDPETGAHLTQMDLETEAFGFIIAGTHTTSATTSLLFYHLLHTPEQLSRCVAEIDTHLPALEEGQSSYPVAVLESSLPFLKQCVKENFRITPVFTMPLARRVVDKAGVTIGDYHFPQGTSLAVCNHAFHHNPEVWGKDHNVFDPARWDQKETNDRARYLMHFGLGPRQCIGKTIATTNIYKLASALLKEFDFNLSNGEERRAIDRGEYIGKIPEMTSVGISDLEAPLMVTVRSRGSGK